MSIRSTVSFTRLLRPFAPPSTAPTQAPNGTLAARTRSSRRTSRLRLSQLPMYASARPLVSSNIVAEDDDDDALCLDASADPRWTRFTPLSTASDSCACACVSSPHFVHVDASRHARDTRRSLSPSRRRSPGSPRPSRCVGAGGAFFAGAVLGSPRRVPPCAARAAPGPRRVDPRDTRIAPVRLIVVVPIVVLRLRRALPASRSECPFPDIAVKSTK